MAPENNNVQPAISVELDWYAKQREAAALLFDKKSISLLAEKVRSLTQN